MDRRLTPTEARILAILRREGGFASYQMLAREAQFQVNPFRPNFNAHAFNLRKKGVSVHGVAGQGLRMEAP